MRPRREQTFNKKKTVNLAKFCLKNTHPDQNETETRLSKIEANETRPRQDCLKNFHSRQDRDEKTEKFCTRPGRDRESQYL